MYASIESIALGVVDLETGDKTIEKSSIGCYVYHNGRLLDVMVISELEQRLELFFNDRAQVIQIVVKQLGHGETKYGKYKDFSMNSIVGKMTNLNV